MYCFLSKIGLMTSLFVRRQVGLFPGFISKDNMFSKLVEPGPEMIVLFNVWK